MPSPRRQESESLRSQLTFNPTLQTTTLQPSNESFQLDAGESSSKKPRGRPKGSTMKRPTPDDGEGTRIEGLPKRPRGRPRKLETDNIPKRPRGRPRKTADTELIPAHESLPPNQINISMPSTTEPIISASASTSGQKPEFMRSSSTVQS